MSRIIGHVEAWLCDKDGKHRKKVVDGHNIFTNDGYKSIIQNGNTTFNYPPNIELITDTGITEDANKHLTDVTVVAETTPIKTYDGTLYKYYYLANAANGKYFAPPSSTRTITAIGLKYGSYLIAYKALTQAIIQDSTQYLEVAYTLTLSYSTDYSDPNALTELALFRLTNSGSFGYGLTLSTNLPNVDKKLIHGASSGLTSSLTKNYGNYDLVRAGSYDAVTDNTGLWNGIMSADGVFKKITGVSIGTVYAHTSGSTSTFFDSNNEATGNATIVPTIPSAWTYANEGGRTRAMFYEIGIVDSGATGVATFKWRRRQFFIALQRNAQIWSYYTTSGWPPETYCLPDVTGLYYSNGKVGSFYHSLSGIWGAQQIVNGEIKTYILSTDGMTLTETDPFVLVEYSTINLTNQLKKFVIQDDGTIWGIGADNKIYKISGGTETSYDIGLTGSSPQNIGFYSGYLWIAEGTTAKKIDPSDGSILQTVTLQYAVFDYERDFSVDSEGNVWNRNSKINSSDSSVILTIPESFSHVTAFGNMIICGTNDDKFSFRDLDGNLMLTQSSNLTIPQSSYYTINGFSGLIYPIVSQSRYGGYAYQEHYYRHLGIFNIPIRSADEYRAYTAFLADHDNTSWKGWDSTNSVWVDYTNGGARTTSSTPIDLEDGVQIAFQDGTEAPQFVATERYIFGVAEGIVKDNLSQFKADLRVGILKMNAVSGEAFTIPSSSPYTYTLLNTTSTGYVRIDSDYELMKVTIDGTEASQITGTPTAGQYAIDFDTGVLTFSADDAGKSASVDYSWLERP